MLFVLRRLLPVAHPYAMAVPDRPIRLDFVITELEVGGAEKCLARIACGLDRSEFACRVVSLAGAPRGSRLLIDQFEAAGIPIEFMDGHSPRSMFAVCRKLRRLWRREPPDLIQSFLFHANVLARLSRPSSRIPHVLGVRVADPRPLRTWLERRVAGRRAAVVCVSDGVAEQLRRRGFRADQLRVIPNGIELSHYYPVEPVDLAPEGIPAGRRLLLVIGRLESQKGLDWLQSLAPELLAAHPDHDLVLVGDGTQRVAIQRRIELLGLTSRMRLLGWRPDIPALLARCELLLLTSRYEGMPNVVLEAMAAGKPIVATRVEGVTDLLGPGSDVQSVPFGDTSELLQRVQAFCNSAELRKQWGQKNLRRASELFSVTDMVHQYARLYRELVL